MPRPDHAPRPDPGRDVSLYRFHHVRPRPDRPGDPQGVHRQARPEGPPGRYPNREASEITPVRLEGPAHSVAEDQVGIPRCPAVSNR